MVYKTSWEEQTTDAVLLQHSQCLVPIASHKVAREEAMLDEDIASACNFDITDPHQLQSGFVDSKANSVQAHQAMTSQFTYRAVLSTD